MSSGWTDLGALDQGPRWAVEVDGRAYAVLVVDGVVHVVDGLCPHRQGRLVEGVLRDGRLVCPSHWYVFDLADGRCGTTPEYALGVYDTDVRDGHVWARLPDPAPALSWSERLRAHARAT